jgi:hypothetical protein
MPFMTIELKFQAGKHDMVGVMSPLLGQRSTRCTNSNGLEPQYVVIYYES